MTPLPFPPPRELLPPYRRRLALPVEGTQPPASMPSNIVQALVEIARGQIYTHNTKTEYDALPPPVEPV